jgi:hypothetical protein
MTEQPIKDTAYDPYPKAIFIHDNTYSASKKWRPTFRNKIGLILWLKFKKKVPNIVYDGILDEEAQDASGKITDRYKICIQEKEGTTFANIDAEHKFKNIQKDIKLHDCAREPIKEVKLGK